MNPTKVFSGITLIFFGMVLYAISKIPAEKVEYGGVVLVGPIPIVFGSNPELMSLAVFAALLLFVLAVMRRW